MRVSVVIPTWNESATIVDTLARLTVQDVDEVVVSDGSSPDGTARLAESAGVRVVDSPRGRGVQQNRGAAATSGDLILFLHADCWLDPDAVGALRRFARRHPRCPCGCFRMGVDDRDPRYRPIETAADLRAGLLGLPYGDQGLFVRRWAFDRVGGFPEIRLMDDLFLVLKLRRLGRVAVIPPRIHVSPRRWQRQGILGQSLRNWLLTAAAASGVHPDRLARYYPAVR